MTETMAVKISIEEAVSLFGRLADAQHVFTEPIRTAASGFEFSSNTAIKPKWLIAYTSRESCGEDVSLPTHHTRWSSLLFADSASTCTREHFKQQLCSAEFATPLGVPKWSVPGKVLVDNKACASAPSADALDVLWTFLGGGDDVLECDAVVAKLNACAKLDDLHEAVLFGSGDDFNGIGSVRA